MASYLSEIKKAMEVMGITEDNLGDFIRQILGSGCEMNYSTKISERLWNVPDKGELESKESRLLLTILYKRVILKKNFCPI